MSKKAKQPMKPLRVLHVTSAGRNVVSVVPKQSTVSIGNQTWACRPRDHLWPGKGPWDVVAVDGQSACLSPWQPTHVTAQEYDTGIGNNLLEQVHNLARGGKSQRVSWVNMGLSFVVILCIIGMGFKLGGDIEDLGDKIAASHPELQAPREDRTTVNNPPNQGSGQSQGQVQAPPGG